MTGDIFCSNSKAIVNPVNCVGRMGKGLALEFKKRFPKNYLYYANLCSMNRIVIGDVTVFTEMNYGKVFATPVLIVNFPTKQHWSNPSQLNWISYGLESLKEVILEKNIPSIAIPALGCGEGGLDWKYVKQEIIAVLGPLQDVNISVYEPIKKE